ncbi:hypothetical protein ETAA8_23450 [Anatilimnocola aggregata]|uniref:Uncharacterized protein n=1 Tax=Anatilimnocola aggregata TaxID=2528021 RepID=A0A517YAK2_9BACT|nr:hypothetical protein [Anatilimnocola aggregata]QDU27258.1 hypothetical protein ETAA8_23450 [Anatilimnocola aggregata]
MPDEITTLQSIAIQVHVVALALTAGGICWAAILAGLSRLPWFWRVSLLCAPLVLLLPIRAYEPLVMLFPLVLALAIAAASLRQRWEAGLGIVPAKLVPAKETAKSKQTATAKTARNKRWKISLCDAWLGMTVIAVTLGVLVQLPWRNLNFSWTGLCFDLALLFAISFISLGVVGLRGGSVWAIAMFICVSLGIVFESTWGDGLQALYLLGVAGPQHLTWTPIGEFYLFFTTLLLVGLWLVRWCWQVIDQNELFQKRRRLVGSVAALTFSPVVVLYMAMFVGPPEVTAPHIRNNVLPELVAVGTELETMGVGEYTLSELEGRHPNTNFSTRVAAIYDHSLRLVKQPGCVALDLKRRADEGSLETQNAQLSTLRGLARRWSREAESAYRDGNVQRGIEFDLATLRLGNHLSRGGICIHAQAAGAIKSLGLVHLAQFRDHLPPTSLPTILNVLDALDAAAEHPEVTNARDRYWTDVAHGWRHRLETVVQGALSIPSTESNGYHTLAQPYNREAAQRRLLSTDLALRLFRHQHDRLPTSLKELVPHILAMMPLDPFTQQPLLYRPLKYSYVLYSTGPDARDDGGKFHRFGSDAYNHNGHDWSLEGVLRPSWRALGRGWGAGFGPRPPRPGNWATPPWEWHDSRSAADKSAPIILVSTEHGAREQVGQNQLPAEIESLVDENPQERLRESFGREPFEPRPFLRRYGRRGERW